MYVKLYFAFCVLRHTGMAMPLPFCTLVLLYNFKCKFKPLHTTPPLS